MNTVNKPKLNRRELLKLGLGAALVGSTVPNPAPSQTCTTGTCLALPPGCGGVQEVFPTSPLILNPFTERLDPKRALAPDPTVVLDPLAQDSDGGVHQLLPGSVGRGLPQPIGYRINLLVAPHYFTHQLVQPIDAGGNFISAPNGIGVQSLPASTIYGFNGTFPGPMINAEYGKPCLVRFINRLHENPYGLDRQDFGSPECEFLTHLHNGHTAPESDGNPNYKTHAYGPCGWSDNLYLNCPAGLTDGEKQSFFWFHDHTHGDTGANVYKGLVGLYPIYDPDHDMGNETKGYHLPGVRTNNPDGSFDVKYDIPLAIYDCLLDDGVTPHQDFHNGCGEPHPEWWGKTFFRHFPNHGFVGDIFTVNGKAFPYMVVNRRRYRLRFLDASIARIYEFRLMRADKVQAFPGQMGQYNLMRKNSSGKFDRGGELAMKMVQIATEGGILPFPFLRDGIEIWPAKRREVIVDFGKYLDGSPTQAGDVIYLTNVLPMSTGRKPDGGQTTTDPDGTTFTTPPCDPTYAVPILAWIVGPDVPDKSLDPMDYSKKDQNGVPGVLKLDSSGLPLLKMRPLPSLPTSFEGVPRFMAELQRSGGAASILAQDGEADPAAPEFQWLINGHPFEPYHPLAFPLKGSAGLWTIRNGGGGWVHPLHIHQEEHRVISRNGVLTPNANDPSLYNKTYNAHEHPDDIGKEDTVALDPSEEVVVYRQFRDFTGKYVAHCHNLAHEDHSMMFGWDIIP